MVEDYREYLKSEAWEKTRKRMLRKHGYRCQLCAAKNVVLDVHHNNYENIGHELDEDLVVLCRTCHDKYHQEGAADSGQIAYDTIRSASEHRAFLLAMMVRVCEGKASVAMANAVVGLSGEFHKSMRQEWDMLVYADEHLSLGRGNRIHRLAPPVLEEVEVEVEEV